MANDGILRSAELSMNRLYRFSLSRAWEGGEGTVCFVMLNPSTADELTDDATIRKCIAYAKRWGYERMNVVNLYAFRATDPRQLFRTRRPIIGVDNDHEIYLISGCSDLVVCGWGTKVKKEREEEVLAVIRKAGKVPHCLRVTKDGHPSHPLYLPGNLTPIPYVTEVE